MGLGSSNGFVAGCMQPQPPETLHKSVRDAMIFVKQLKDVQDSLYTRSCYLCRRLRLSALAGGPL